MLFDELKATIPTAMKAHDSVTLDTVRFLLAAVRNVAIAKYGAEGEARLTDEDVLDVIKKQVKTHIESVEAFTKAGRLELAAAEKAQLEILEKYLPKQLSDEELKTLLAPIVADTGDLPAQAGFGPMMGKAMKLVAGKADGNKVSEILRALIASK